MNSKSTGGEIDHMNSDKIKGSNSAMSTNTSNSNSISTTNCL